jgi:hypothetical protein
MAPNLLGKLEGGNANGGASTASRKMKHIRERGFSCKK